MFQINDVVVHYRDGVSVITGTITMGDSEYFTIRAKRVGDVSIYVPVLKAINIIRKVMTKEEADKLIEHMNKLPEVYISNTKQRRDEFKRRLSSGNIEDIAFLTKLYILFIKDGFATENVKFGPMDLEMLKDAYNRLLDEFSVSYNVDREEVDSYIQSKLMF